MDDTGRLARGRPAFRTEKLEVGLTAESQAAHRWLMKRWGLTSKTATANEALVQHARALGWKGRKP